MKLVKWVLLGAAVFMASDSQRQVKKQVPAVVEIMNSQRTYGGTGFYVRAKSGALYILTNAHICRGDSQFIIFDGNNTELTNIKQIYDKNDLCLLNPAESRHKSVSLAGSVSDLDSVYILGHPYLEPLTLTSGFLTKLYTITMNLGPDLPCTGYNQHAYYPSPTDLSGVFFYASGYKYLCLQDLVTNPVTATILPGNSGSPVLNYWGHLVGVAFAANDSGSHGYIVPLSYVRDFLSAF